MSPSYGYTHYQTLEIPPDAPVIEVKRAYRRLAVVHHPDRGGSNRRFQQISEAYQTLSVESLRREYDWTLEQEGHSSNRQQPVGHRYSEDSMQRRREVHAQFQELFTKDPFFREAFRDMDDDFARRFKNQGNGDDWWQFMFCGFSNQLTESHSSAKSKRGKSDIGTKKQTSIYYNALGERVALKKMERNGDCIEDKFIAGRLVERRINGIVQESVQTYME